MFWPTVLAHKIDSDSPLWAVSARQLASSAGTFEVVLTFEGTTPETGNTVQVMQIRTQSVIGFDRFKSKTFSKFRGN